MVGTKALPVTTATSITCGHLGERGEEGRGEESHVFKTRMAGINTVEMSVLLVWVYSLF